MRMGVEMTNFLTLYHGTTHDFNKIDVQKGKPFKDFGQGFYLSKIFEHAHNLAFRNRRIEEMRLKAMGRETQLPVYVYEYKFDMANLEKLEVKRFTSPDRDWLKFIIANRMNYARQHNYDIVIGPTANDETRTSIRTVMNAANGAILSDTALDLLIEMLEPNVLPEQYYFGTSKSAAMLKFGGRRKI